ncbi:23S rRNA (guanosine(2251)-2'-O)-methyltransferase RlmB [Rhodohalobacter mucosus]|uniref:23S rRNA (Guanosine(2251)-2'-O)-methyltransferase RlmB n=1 Tax=Rhodohalobacter mucosus TaxID=2079485 RepID=A0A316TSE5_9BACT|nr:23S rRNA (guanosine(2251)-2'-O)-methyltransferase RlmB [Rhodohalobacter mucosus]PWN05142.1 23S rRNA (guanosine(2251)-2'-O)-methyltransferase RlmB [Rhodohalobacter mucosus]
MGNSNQYIYGRKPVEELLQHSPEKVEKVYLRKNLHGSVTGSITELCSKNRIPVTDVPGKKLFEMVGSVNDQGVVAAISSAEYVEFEAWLDALQPHSDTAVLILDEIEDPHNFGAILRTAAATGIEAVIVPKHRQAPVNATVFKTSAGTAGRIPIVRAVNLNRAILDLKDKSFWVAGLDQQSETSIWNQTFDVPMAFVIGNEGKGMRQKTGEHCDFLLSVPMHNNVESLNASVSAAIVCYEWLRQKNTQTS